MGQQFGKRGEKQLVARGLEKPIRPLTFLCNRWMFPKIGVPQNGWFIMETPIKLHDLGGFPPIFGNIQM